MRNGHFSTIFTALFRGAGNPPYHRETLLTGDGDFLDLDVVKLSGSDKARRPRVVILIHGLEGSADAHYVRAMAVEMNALGWHTVSMNLRGCSGRPNATEKSYHSGSSDDLQAVVEWTEQQFPDCEIAIVGYSLGGNITLKYMGEGIRRSSVSGAVAVSVPCHLPTSAIVLARMENRIYMHRFMRDLVAKLEAKNRNLGTSFNIPAFRKMRTFAEFDGAYTAPVHGFASAEDYWTRVSSRQFLQQIDVPTLLINALNDPFLSPECFPTGIAAKSDTFFLETPRFGGHVGFIQSLWSGNHCWQESRVSEFLRSQVFSDT